MYAWNGVSDGFFMCAWIKNIDAGKQPTNNITKWYNKKPSWSESCVLNNLIW